MPETVTETMILPEDDRDNTVNDPIAGQLLELAETTVSPLSLLPHGDLREKLVDLIINGEPSGLDPETTRLFSRLSNTLMAKRVDQARVVVFGGGTGLSNIIGGDCRSDGWARAPFSGLKEIFPNTSSVVCVTDDGGSTGELLKDLPLMAIGDIRHVLISSIQLALLQRSYQISISEAKRVAAEMARLFNFRYLAPPQNSDELIAQSGADLELLPYGLREILRVLIEMLFNDPRLQGTLKRPHCLGNLIVTAAIYHQLDPALENEDIVADRSQLHDAIHKGLHHLSMAIGCHPRAAWPCTTTPSQLRVVYSNGIQTTGESKSSIARRGFPVESVHVDFCGEVVVNPDLINDIEQADILILAPGSLYSSIIPIFMVPGLADAVRKNSKALKVLVSNLWVQAGETDLSMTDPERKFRVSDMIRAYERNIPGGTCGLFNEVLCLSLKDVPASVIQRYAVEEKIPIYLDREVVREQGYTPVECGIFSRQALAERGVIQHDPTTLATVIRVLYAGGSCFPSAVARSSIKSNDAVSSFSTGHRSCNVLPSLKYQRIEDTLARLDIQCSGACGRFTDEEAVRRDICEIIWSHHDIPLNHLDHVAGIDCVDVELWRRNQEWDNVYSFYEPEDRRIKIRCDQVFELKKLEMAFLIALGQSLLGNYAKRKMMCDLIENDIFLGKVYHIYLRETQHRDCYFTADELDTFLQLTRMYPGRGDDHYTRLISGEEGFTPPGLFMGLMYAWYLENRLTTHIEYKMTVMKIPHTDLIHEQRKMVQRRMQIIAFFRDVVFNIHS